MLRGIAVRGLSADMSILSYKDRGCDTVTVGYPWRCSAICHMSNSCRIAHFEEMRRSRHNADAWDMRAELNRRRVPFVRREACTRRSGGELRGNETVSTSAWMSEGLSALLRHSRVPSVSSEAEGEGGREAQASTHATELDG